MTSRYRPLALAVALALCTCSRGGISTSPHCLLIKVLDSATTAFPRWRISVDDARFASLARACSRCSVRENVNHAGHERYISFANEYLYLRSFYGAASRCRRTRTSRGVTERTVFGYFAIPPFCRRGAWYKGGREKAGWKERRDKTKLAVVIADVTS